MLLQHSSPFRHLNFCPLSVDLLGIIKAEWQLCWKTVEYCEGIISGEKVWLKCLLTPFRLKSGILEVMAIPPIRHSVTLPKLKQFT